MRGRVGPGVLSPGVLLSLGIGVILSGGHGISPRPLIRGLVQYSGIPAPASKPLLNEAYGKLPLAFEANTGQADPEVRFLSRGNGYTLFLTATEAVLSLSRTAVSKVAGRENNEVASKGTVLRVKLVRANPEPTVVGINELPGKSNYFIGNDPTKWRTNVPNYARVEYRDVYSGVNLVYYGNQRQVEYDFVVAPGADPARIRFSVEGADKVEVDSQGDLVLQVKGGEIRFHKPVVCQETDGARRQIAGGFVLTDGTPHSAFHTPHSTEVGFEIAAYDATRPLVIDPTLAYSTYFGGPGNDSAYAIAVNSSGNVYITGSTFSANFPTGRPWQSALYGSSDAFVAKLNVTGSALVYSTYLGGSAADRGLGIAVDASGNAYVTGQTYSSDFPTVNALQRFSAGGGEAFVTKLNASGSALAYSTYFGGSKDDIGTAIAVDVSGAAYVTGGTNPVDATPIVSPILSATFGYVKAFVVKLNPAGSALLYAVYFGGSGFDWPTGIAVGFSGNAYVVGYTSSFNFPTRNPLQVQGPAAEDFDAFVVKLNSLGSDLIYATYLGGSNADGGLAIAVDASDNAYIAGETSSTNFPRTAGCLQAALKGTQDAFVAKLNAAGSALVYSTYLGGGGIESAVGIAVDTAGNAYVTGWTSSRDFPTAGPLQPASGGGTKAFVAKLDPVGSALAASTYLGGSGGDAGQAIAVDTAGNVYVAGWTSSCDFPTASPLQAACGGGSDAFVVKISGIATQCTYSIVPESQSFSLANSATGTVTLTAVKGCSWTATSSATWLTITSGDAGNDNGTVSYSLLANPSSISRTATLTIADKTFTVTQAGASCTYSITPASQTLPASGAGGIVWVTAPIGCPWTAVSNDNWITITAGSNGSGDGRVDYSVTANTGNAARTGTLMIAGRTFTATQATLICTYSIAPRSQSFLASGGTGSVAVTASGGCTWTAVSNDKWITVTSGSSGVDNGVVNYSVAASSATVPRTGTLTIAGQTFTVAQAPSGCNYSIVPASQSFPGRGGTGSVAVTATAGCSWTATSSDNWITITSGSSGSGNGTVTYSVAVNASATSRTGTPTIAWLPFTVIQAGAPTLGVSPPALTFTGVRGASSPASQTLQVVASDGSAIPWTAAVSTATGGTWLSVLPVPASGMTPASVSVVVNTAGMASGSYAGQVSVTTPGATPLIVRVTLTLKESGGQPVISVTPASLQFTVGWGTNPEPQTITVANVGGGTLNWLGTPIYTSGSGWLSITPSGGNAPTGATVSIDTVTPRLPVGTYLCQIVISALGAISEPVSLPVTLDVKYSTALVVSPGNLTFQAARGIGAPEPQAISIAKVKSEPVNWTATTTTTGSGGNWLRISPNQGMAPATVTVSVDATGLAANTYSGYIGITDTASKGAVSVRVDLLVNPQASIILLSQSTFVFTTVEKVSPPPQNLQIFNVGQGTLTWYLQATTSGSTGNWLSVAQTNGYTRADDLTSAQPVSVRVYPPGLSPGDYSGSLVASAGGATNTPQRATVHLRTVSATSNPVPSVLPTGFVFSMLERGASPKEQAFTVQNIGGGTLSFRVSVSTTNGGAWLAVTQPERPVTATQPVTINVQVVNSSNLQAGVYRGTVALNFDDGTTQGLSVLLLVLPAGVTASRFEGPGPRSAACVPTELYAVSTVLPNNFSVLAGWPVPIVVKVIDNCGNAVTGATVYATFLGTGDPPLPLKSLPNGLYTGTWVPLSSRKVTLNIKVVPLQTSLPQPEIELKGEVTASTNAPLPLINAGGVVNGASFKEKEPVAAGSIISLFGRNLLQTPTQAPAPLPRTLAGLSVNIGGIDAPLFYAGPEQVNAQVPFELSTNAPHSVVVTLGGKISPPESLLIADVRPGLFSYQDGAINRGAILDERNVTISKSNPALAGKLIQIFATGLGPTNPAVKTGDPAPSQPLAVLVGTTKVTVTIGGVSAPIEWKGLAPGFTGLYQVNVRVPLGLAGDLLPLVLTANGEPSNAVMLAVK